METTHQQLMAKVYGDIVDWLNRTGDPEVVASRCGYIIEQLQNLEAVVAARRSAAIRVMRAEGRSYGEIAAALDMSRARVAQLADR